LNEQNLHKLNRSFGLVMAGGLGVLAVIRFAWSGAMAWWLIGLGFGFLLAGLLVPAWLNPVRAGWMKVAEVLGVVNTRILLTVVFVGLITPMALLLRLLGKRPIDLGATDAASYWHKRRAEEFAAGRMERQF